MFSQLARQEPLQNIEYTVAFLTVYLSPQGGLTKKVAITNEVKQSITHKLVPFNKIASVVSPAQRRSTTFLVSPGASTWSIHNFHNVRFIPIPY